MRSGDYISFIILSGTTALALTAIFHFVRSCWRGLRKFFDKIDQIEEVLNHELHPNSGSSMKDQLNRMDEWMVTHTEIHEDLGKCPGCSNDDGPTPGDLMDRLN